MEIVVKNWNSDCLINFQAIYFLIKDFQELEIVSLSIKTLTSLSQLIPLNHLFRSDRKLFYLPICFVMPNFYLTLIFR